MYSILMKKSRWLSSVVLLSSSLVCALCLRLYCDSDHSGKYVVVPVGSTETTTTVKKWT